jgi:hypothetical protein
MCICIAVAFVIPERPAFDVVDEETGEAKTMYRGHGYDHAEFSTMDVGGPGKDRHEHIIWLVWALGALICIFFVTCLEFGVQRDEKIGSFGLPILIGGVVYVATWTMLMLSYNKFMNGEGLDERFLLLPKPTAWMIYGIWGVPAFFIILFMFKFNSQYWNEDLEKEFNAILARRDARDGGGDE